MAVKSMFAPLCFAPSLQHLPDLYASSHVNENNRVTLDSHSGRLFLSHSNAIYGNSHQNY